MKSISLPLPVPAGHAESEARLDDQRTNQGEFSFRNIEPFLQPGTLLLLPENKPPAKVKRFVILVPAEPFSLSDLSLKMGQYTLPGTSLLFVTRVADSDQEYTARRQLALLENIARSPCLQVQSQLFYNEGWMGIVNDIWHEGDLIICLEDHRIRHFMVGSVSIGREIFTKLHVPVLIHQDIHIWEPSPIQKRFREMAALASMIVTILLFTLLQIKVDLSFPGGPGRVLLCLTLIVEFFFIWKINAFFG